MKLLNGSGCQFPDSGGNEGYPATTDYDSRRTGNGLLDTGSTPVYSTLGPVTEPMAFGFHFGYSTHLARKNFVFSCFFIALCDGIFFE